MSEAVESAFAAPAPDSRRGLLWTGAAPVEAGKVRLGVGTGGGWLATFSGLQVAGGGAEVDGAWAITERVAWTATAGAGVGWLRQEGPVRGFGGVSGLRVLLVDAERIRFATFAAGAGAPGLGMVGGGVAIELPVYAVCFDLALPLGGVVVAGTLPDAIPLTSGPFAPLFLLGEAGFTWRLGDHTSFRLGYVALATSWSWRWQDDRFTLEVSGYTNGLTGNASVRGGVVF